MPIQPARNAAPTFSGVLPSGGDPGIDGWIASFVSRFASGDPAERRAAMRDLASDFAPRLGPSAPRYGPMIDALRRETNGGRLDGNPEARLGLAAALLTRGDPAGARAEIREAVRLAGGPDGTGIRCNGEPDRARASEVNREAARLYGQLGDPNDARIRWSIARYFAATADHRRAGFGVPVAPPADGQPEWTGRRNPTIGPPDPLPAPPPALKRPTNEGPPNVPPSIEGRPLRGAQAAELFNLIGAFVGAHSKMMALADYVECVERARLERDVLPPPPRPDVVRATRNLVINALNLGTAAQRASAARILNRTDFDLLEESAKAYWGIA